MSDARARTGYTVQLRGGTFTRMKNVTRAVTGQRATECTVATNHSTAKKLPREPSGGNWNYFGTDPASPDPDQ